MGGGEREREGGREGGIGNRDPDLGGRRGRDSAILHRDPDLGGRRGQASQILYCSTEQNL